MIKTIGKKVDFKLSIVMPVYHAERYIRERLSDLLSHGLTDIQLVVVICEDGFDKSVEKCSEMLNGIDNVKIIIQPEQGLSVARNTGLHAAEGKYVLFMDSDDVLLKEGFTQLKNTILSATSDMSEVIVCKYVLLQQGGRDIWPDYSFPESATADEARMFIYADLPDSVWNVWRYVCRREFLLENNLFFVPDLNGEDVEWTPRILDSAKSIDFMETPLYGYCYKQAGQLSRRINVKRTKDINVTVAEGINRYKNKSYGKPLCYRLIRESFFSISDYCRYSAAERKSLFPYIDECVKNYVLSEDIYVRLFIKTQRFIPLYFWSLALALMKVTRGLAKGFLGANTAKPFNSFTAKRYQRKDVNNNSTRVYVFDIDSEFQDESVEIKKEELASGGAYDRNKDSVSR